MTKKYLNQIFKMVLGYNYEDSVERKDLRYMHQIIYLLQELGFPADDYGFSWCIYEIYSGNLQKDLMSCNFNKQTCQDIKFRKEFVEKINKLKKIIESEQKGNYSTGQWLDCLSALCYLKKYIMPPTDHTPLQATEVLCPLSISVIFYPYFACSQNPEGFFDFCFSETVFGLEDSGFVINRENG